MASQAQIIANRENARHSTGPRTEEGKSRTRLNGIRHGLTGQTVLLPEEDRETYHRHCHGILISLKPEGAIETQISQSIAYDYWRLNRIKAIEDNIFALGIEAHDGDSARGMAHTFLEESRQFNLLSLYESRLNRAVAKKLAELRELQRIRKVNAATKGNGSGFSIAPVGQSFGSVPMDLRSTNRHEKPDARCGGTRSCVPRRHSSRRLYRFFEGAAALPPGDFVITRMSSFC